MLQTLDRYAALTQFDTVFSISLSWRKKAFITTDQNLYQEPVSANYVAKRCLTI